ncbi:MAG: hypothetical protein WBI14_05115 [Anaerolineaceae bacterium]
MKKILFSLLLSIVMVFSFGVTVFAAGEGDDESNDFTLPSNVIVQRVDVPLLTAIIDPSFSVAANAQNKASSGTLGLNSVYWNVWGDKRWNPNTYLYIPIGYSEHKDGNTVLSTYHYTRTYLGPSWTPRGDSGRVWGSYTVMAVGTDCTQDEWDVFVHQVFYGTAD